MYTSLLYKNFKKWNKRNRKQGRPRKMSRQLFQNKQLSYWTSKKAMPPGKQIVRVVYLDDKPEFKVFGAL